MILQRFRHLTWLLGGMKEVICWFDYISKCPKFAKVLETPELAGNMWYYFDYKLLVLLSLIIGCGATLAEYRYCGSVKIVCGDYIAPLMKTGYCQCVLVV
jgi:hypothetical protein